jgi:hypothetical protein
MLQGVRPLLLASPAKALPHSHTQRQQLQRQRQA